MKPIQILSSLYLASLPITGHAATIVESWQFNDDPGTQLSALSNDAGTAAWAGDKANAVTNGTGALNYTVGETSSDNVFRNATLSTPNVSTGIYEMQWTYLTATLAGGDGGGANVGFGMRDESGSDLFLVRLQRQNSRLLLQTRVGSTNATLDNFGSAITSLPDMLAVRVVADLDADTFDVFWKLGSGTEESSTGIAFSGTGLEFDQLRMTANTNTTDWGASDSVSVDFLTVTQIPEPGTLSLIGLALAGAVTRRRR